MLKGHWQAQLLDTGQEALSFAFPFFLELIKNGPVVLEVMWSLEKKTYESMASSHFHVRRKILQCHLVFRDKKWYLCRQLVIDLWSQ